MPRVSMIMSRRGRRARARGASWQAWCVIPLLVAVAEDGTHNPILPPSSELFYAVMAVAVFLVPLVLVALVASILWRLHRKAVDEAVETALHRHELRSHQ